MKKVVFLIGLAAALLLGACTAPALPDQSASPQNLQLAAPVQQTVQQPQPRTISVNGVGQVTLAPDVAYVYVGVQSQSAEVADALTQNNQKAQAISDALQQLGIETSDIQTSSFNIAPQQNYGPQGEITGTTYNVNNTVYVTVRNLQTLGQLLDVVVRAGANSINSVTFDVLDKNQGLSEARRLAVESARSQADEIAQMAGVTVSELQSMNVYNSSAPVPVDNRGTFATDAAQVPVSAGQIIIRVEVGAVYTIQ